MRTRHQIWLRPANKANKVKIRDRSMRGYSTKFNVPNTFTLQCIRTKRTIRRE